MGRLISADPIKRVRRVFHREPGDQGYTIEDVQDVTDIVEQNKAIYNTYRGSWEKHGEWGDRYASIPSTIWGDLIRKGIANDEERLRKWLDERDNRVFRTRPGRMSK